LIAATLAIATPLAAVSGFAYATISPTSDFWGPVIPRGPVGSKRVALTFDDGPTPGATDRVLDVLRDRDVRAAFFVIGENVLRSPDLLHRIHDEGHLVANHSFGHSHYCAMGLRGYWEREIRTTDDAIESVIGVRPTLFRPPMGVRTWHTFWALRRTGHSMITWSRRAIDGIPTKPRRILARFAGAADGDILLLHDGVEPHAPYRDRSATIAAVGPLVDRIREKGLTPVRLDELLQPAEHRV
jgi:peptidoglycan/xylan/chitin deacetylase (PgdA/CDA1 family)